MARTAGHPLSVVEYLRALAQGDAGVPESLADAVLTRVARLDDAGRAVVEAAAVAAPPHRPGPAWPRWSRSSDVATTRVCEELVRLRLLVRSGHHYEFANDLLQECVHAALPPALALAYHRRAADLTADRPEVMAEHAYAAGDGPRAAQGWLLAGEAALAAGRGRGRPRPARPVARGGDRRSPARGPARCSPAAPCTTPARTFADALADIDAALALARSSGDRRLEMAALRMRGGDAAVGLGLTVDELVSPLEEGLRLAADLGDRRAEADFSSRLAILEASRLRLDDRAGQGRAVGRPRPGSRVGGRARAGARRSQDGLVLPRRPRPARRGGRRSSSPCCAAAATPGCCSGRCSSRRSCPPARAAWTTPGRGSPRRSS